MSDLLTLNAADLAALIRTGDLSPLELIDQSLQRIEKVQPELNPFCFVFADQARDQAKQMGSKPGRSDKHTLPPLFGLPIAIKDFTPTKGQRTTRGSYAYEHWIPDHDAEIVKRLKQAGAIIIGKTTTPEFAWSSFTRSKLWGDTLNPWGRTRTCGGSSGGSAVAVTTGCVALAEGTDMGGSVRIPAALCGIVGHKPSLGRIPMDLLDTCFDNISHFGPLARSVSDAALFMQATEGPHDCDIQSQHMYKPIDYEQAPSDSLQNLVIAVSEDLGFYAIDNAVRENFQKTVNLMETLGATVKPVKLNWSARYAEAWVEIWSVFLASAFGHAVPQHESQMDEELVALMKSGLQMKAVDYRRLDVLRTQQWHELAQIFTDADCLICPTMAKTAPAFDAKDSEFEHTDSKGRLHGLDMTAIFNNIPQCPALSLPSGFDTVGLPTAIQLVGKRFADPLVFRIAAALEESQPWKRWTLKENKV